MCILKYEVMLTIFFLLGNSVHGDTIRTLSGHASWVTSVAVSSDGVHVASGYALFS